MPVATTHLENEEEIVMVTPTAGKAVKLGGYEMSSGPSGVPTTVALRFGAGGDLHYRTRFESAFYSVEATVEADNILSVDDELIAVSDTDACDVDITVIYEETP